MYKTRNLKECLLRLHITGYVRKKYEVETEDYIDTSSIESILKIIDVKPFIRRYLMMYFDEGKSYKEIADVLGISEELAKRMRYDAVQTMDRKLSNELECRVYKERNNMVGSLGDMHIRSLGLSLRTYNALRRGGCETVSDILKSHDELMHFRQVGEKTEKEINDKLREIGAIL